MKPLMILAMAASLVGGARSQAIQNSSQARVPPGFVDGSINPELIADHVAYRLVFLNLMLPRVVDQTAVARQDAKMRAISLSDQDKVRLKELLAQFSLAYSLWQGKVARQVTTGISAPSLEAEIQTTVQQYQSQLVTELSPAGAAQFAKYIASAKRRMIVRP